MKLICKIILLTILYIFFLTTVTPSFASNNWPADSGTLVGNTNNLGAGYEPSGAVWHSRLNKLIIVGDDGDVTITDSNGSNVTTWHPGGDIEGVTIANPATDYIYLGIEQPDSIKEFNIATGELTGKTWDLTNWMTGPSNSGLEALTFVPNGKHPYSNSTSGGLFYAGLQNDGKIYIFDINLSSNGVVSHIGTITPLEGISDISGLNYNIATNTLYAIFDGNNLLVEMEPDGTVVAEYVLPGNDQEGIAVVTSYPSTEAQVYICEDTGPRVWRYGGYPVNYPSSSYNTKNIILFIGDGMGQGQATLGRIFSVGPSGFLNMETLDNFGLVTTNSLSGITDSAAGATAMTTGHKVYNGYLSKNQDNIEYQTILEQAKILGKRTGLITTTAITDATPSAFGSHTDSRNNWDEIAYDYIYGSQPNILFGGGKKYFIPSNESGSVRSDNGLIDNAQSQGYTYIDTSAELALLDMGTKDKLLGLFNLGNINYIQDRDTNEPSLPTMVEKALDLLKEDSDGFFLMVEGGRIDHACHANNITNAVYEIKEFDDAVSTALTWLTAHPDTLLIVTADHETGGLQVIDGEYSEGDIPDVTWSTTNHTNASVQIWGKGPGSENISGTLDNTDIFNIMLNAMIPYPNNKWYLPEGCTNGFSEWVLIMNPNSQSAPVRVTFMKPDGSTVTDEITIGATSRYTIHVNQYVPNDSVSTMVESLDNIPIIVERSMYWNCGNLSWGGGHNSTGITSLSKEWYLAEGATLGGFSEWILIMNPNTQDANITVTFMKPDGSTVIKTATVAATSRYTIHVNQHVSNDSVSAKITSDIPIAAERSMYWDSGGYSWVEGHVATGVTTPFTQWFLTEGCTDGFDEWVLIMNPNTQATPVTITFMKPDGSTVVKTITVPATSRYTIYVNDYVPDTSVSTRIMADLPVIAERAMYWDSGDINWAGGHVSQGAIVPETSWYLAEGHTGGSFITWLLIMNPNSADANVKVTFMKPNGSTTEKYLTIKATSRYTINVNDYMPNDSVSIRVESINEVPIIAERSMYWDSGNYHWKAGHASIGVK